jgi:hypothetical protein
MTCHVNLAIQWWIVIEINKNKNRATRRGGSSLLSRPMYLSLLEQGTKKHKIRVQNGEENNVMFFKNENVV